MKKCNYCGAEMDDCAKYCTVCGKSLQKECNKCGCQNETSARFCKGCGTEFDEVRIDYKAPEKLNLVGISNCQHLYANGCGTVMFDTINVDISKIFTGNDLVEEIILPNINVIPEHAFDGCCNLRKITLPDSVTEIGYCAFYLCNNMKEINFPSKIMTIGNCAFHRCESLKEIVIPSSVKIIGAGAFSECTGLKKLTIVENDDITIESRAFADCCSLEEVRINGGKKLGKHAFLNCRNMNLLSIKIKEIDDFAFQNCGNLSKIFLSCYADCIETIAESAFFGCNSYANSELLNYRGIKKYGSEFDYVRHQMMQ